MAATRRTRTKTLLLLLASMAGLNANSVQAQASALTPEQLVRAMVEHENDESAHRDRYEFLSNERSERTGGHLWTERVVETADGRIRFLVAEDGQPLSSQRQQQETAQLAAIVAEPDAFVRKEQAQKNDEAQARKMLELLPRAFIFDNVRLSDGVWRMDFHPNPAYSPSGIQERVLCGMSGWVAIDEHDQRLRHIEGALPQDISIGFGLLATIKAGSRFSSDRASMDGHWRTVRVSTDIRGKAALFKSVAKRSEISRSEFHYLDAGTTIPQAVALVEHPTAP
jgi:hypothetical protein